MFLSEDLLSLSGAVDSHDGLFSYFMVPKNSILLDTGKFNRCKPY